jgi:hypothetical protein
VAFGISPAAILGAFSQLGNPKKESSRSNQTQIRQRIICQPQVNTSVTNNRRLYDKQQLLVMEEEDVYSDEAGLIVTALSGGRNGNHWYPRYMIVPYSICDGSNAPEEGQFTCRGAMDMSTKLERP